MMRENEKPVRFGGVDNKKWGFSQNRKLRKEIKS